MRPLTSKELWSISPAMATAIEQLQSGKAVTDAVINYPLRAEFPVSRISLKDWLAWTAITRFGREAVKEHDVSADTIVPFMNN